MAANLRFEDTPVGETSNHRFQATRERQYRNNTGRSTTEASIPLCIPNNRPKHPTSLYPSRSRANEAREAACHGEQQRKLKEAEPVSCCRLRRLLEVQVVPLLVPTSLPPPATVASYGPSAAAHVRTLCGTGNAIPLQGWGSGG